MKILSRSIFLFLMTVSTISSTAQTTKIPADLKITLERTMCFGTCPDYTLTIKADRSVVFKGGRFTKKKGTATSRISKTSLLKLVKEFDRVDLNSFADDYSQGGMCDGGFITDLPSEIFTLTRDSKTKKVNHYFGCMGKTVQEKLKPLTELGKMIDLLTNSKRWVVK